MKSILKWILICGGAVILAAAIAAFVFWCVAQRNVKDKGGMENPNHIREDSASVGEDITDNISDEQ